MATSFTGWGETIALSFAFVVVLASILGVMNSDYDKSYSLPLNTSQSTDFIDFMDNSKEQVNSGEVVYDSSSGMTFKQAWGVLRGFTSLVWGFISGGWIENLGVMLDLGEGGMILMFYLRMLFFVGVVFAILYSTLKVV
jgi:hypothetical protein